MLNHHPWGPYGMFDFSTVPDVLIVLMAAIMHHVEALVLVCIAIPILMFVFKRVRGI